MRLDGPSDPSVRREQDADRPARLLVICPIHNEERNIAYFFGRLKKALDALDPREYSYRLLFTNNRSTDGSLAAVQDLQRSHPWVGYLTLSRNHGYQLSVLAGIASVDADLYMICDADCEDPPELVADFASTIRAGADLAYGIRNNREEPWVIGRFRSLFYVLLKAVGDYLIVPYMAEFAMFTRPVRDVIIASDNSAPFMRAEFGYAGFNIVGVPYRREARRHGRTHYNFVGNVRFAVAGFLSSTTFPLRAIFYALPAVVVLSVLLLLAIPGGVLGAGGAAAGLIFVNGVYLSASLGFMALYLARVYHNSLRRTRFIVDRSLTALPAAPSGQPS